MAELKAEAVRIESETELECQTQAREAEISFVREQNNLLVSKSKALSKVEVCVGGWVRLYRPSSVLWVGGQGAIVPESANYDCLLS